jgi:hypothetical protein
MACFWNASRSKGYCRPSAKYIRIKKTVNLVRHLGNHFMKVVERGFNVHHMSPFALLLGRGLSSMFNHC